MDVVHYAGRLVVLLLRLPHKLPHVGTPGGLGSWRSGAVDGDVESGHVDVQNTVIKVD